MKRQRLTLRQSSSPGLEGWLGPFLERNHSSRVVSRGRLQFPALLAGFVAMIDGAPVALAAYRIDSGECEIVTLHSEAENQGAGTALLERVKRAAANAGCRRLWLVTTNDNTYALRFYQRRGFHIVAVHVGAIDEYRRSLKPEIPLTGNDGISILDEIELELRLDAMLS